MVTRISSTCMLRPEDVTPSHDYLEVVGAFNPGAIAINNEVVLLVRIAERPKEKRDGYIASPRWEPDTGMTIDWFAEDDVIMPDPRLFEVKATETIRLTFISHLLVAKSADGKKIDSFEEKRFVPGNECEVFGIEDPRITVIDGRYYFTYVAVSQHGAATALASTSDFKSFERHGIIFPVENKDVVLFPEKINGEYVAFHRPNPATHFTQPEMWLASSPDLIHWGKHEVFHGGAGEWETGRIGAGVPPFRVDGGWLEIYHGNDKSPDDEGIGIYSAGLLLLNEDNPQHILKRSSEPVMVPEADFEREGFVPDVIFPTGVVEQEDKLLIYYGAADANVGVVEYSRNDLLATLG